MPLEQRILGLIPARGGSKEVPRKNIRHVAGKPLLAYTCQAALTAKTLTRVVVSTEDAEIASVAQHYGVDVLARPLALASDEAPGIAPVLHALEALPGYDYVVLLQPTSPLRLASDIDQAVSLCLKTPAPACVSLVEANENPHWMFWLEANQRLRPVLTEWGNMHARRQDLPTVFVPNGAVYVAQSAWLLNTKSFYSPETLAYVMPRERSLDIDTEADLQTLEFILKTRLHC